MEYLVIISWLPTSNPQIDPITYERVSRALDFVSFEGTHSYDRIAQVLTSVRLAYKIPTGKIVATITDNGEFYTNV